MSVAIGPSHRALVGRHRHLLGSSAAIVATTALNSVLGYAFWTVVARTFPQGRVGFAAALIAAATGVALMTSQSQSPHLLGALPRASTRLRRELIDRSCLIAIGAGAGIALAAGGLALAIAPSTWTWLTPTRVLVFAVLAAATGLATLLDSAAIGVRAAGLVPARNALFAVAKLAAIAAIAPSAAAVEGGDVIVIVWTSAAVLSCGTGYIAIRRACSRNVVDAAGDLHEQTRGAAVHQYLGAVGGGLPAQVLPVLVAALAGAEAAARFNMAWLIGGACFMLSPALATALLAEGAREPARLLDRARLTARVSAAVLVPSALLLTVLAPEFLRIFGSAYADGATVLLLVALAWSSLPDALANLGVSVFRVRRRLQAAAAVNVAAAVTAIAGTWLLVPAIGIVGAGVAWLVSQLVASALVLALSWNEGAR